ncbi:MAG: hypothetical protein LBQ20_01445, partial [Rhodanobacter sp.]|nr:hypothetical protein [Rhodanobacter sp.]
MKRRDFLISLPIAATSVPSVRLAFVTTSEHRYPIEVRPDRIVIGAASDKRNAKKRMLREATLQEAVDIASKASLPLEIRPGIYRAEELAIEAPLSLWGTPGKTIIESGARGAMTLDIRPREKETRLSAVSISGLVFRGMSLAHAKTIDPAERPIHTLPHAPKHFNGLVTAYCVDRLAIRDCVFDGASGTAIGLWRCREAEITNNEIKHSSVALFSYAGRGNVFA